MLHRSNLFILGALALLSACSETSSVASPTVRATADKSVAGNSATAKACQKNGWKDLVTSTGGSFASQDECVSYGAHGGVLFQKQSITFAALPAKSFGDADFTVTASASSGLPVTFTATGNCTVTGTTVHLTGAGSCTITAHQAGNATWFAAADVARTFAIGSTQSVAFTSTSRAFTLKGAPSYTPTAKATSGLTVSITLDATSIGCSLSSGVVTFTGAGTCVIDANQAGDANWSAAPQQQQSITVYACIDTEALLRYAASVGGDYSFCAAGTKVVLTSGEIEIRGSTSLSLSGVGGTNAVIDANHNGRVFRTTGHLTLEDITVTGGQISTALEVSGGGIYVGGGTLVLNGKTAIDGNSALAGGGIHLSSATLTMNDASTISNNVATIFGDPDFSTGLGGGLDVNSGTIVMNGSSTIRKNVAAGSIAWGGGVMMNGGVLTMNGSSAITENTAGPIAETNSARGGGVFVLTSASVTLNDAASITGNTAASDGGGLYLSQPNFGIVTGVTATNVINNTPNNCGGAPVAGCVNP